MARRSPRNTAEAPAEASTETQEAPVSTTEETAPAAEATPAETPIDLTDFTAAVEAAVEEADTTTGTVPEASIAKVSAEYRKLEGLKAKNAAKKLVADGMKDAMNGDSLPRARSYMNLQEKALVAASGGGGGSTRQPADPTEAFVQRVATLNLASTIAQSNVPDGIAENWGERVGTLVTESTEAATSYLQWLTGDEDSRGEEPEVSQVVKNAAKLAQGKAAKAGGRAGGAGTPFTGERRDIAKHIVEAFENEPEGKFLRVSEIRKFRSNEYGDNLPSAGAISIRLFPNKGESSMTKLGIKPDTQDGKKGAVKVAASE